jgi:hypothetical protein
MPSALKENSHFYCSSSLKAFFKTSLTSATDVYDKKKNTQNGGGLSFGEVRCYLFNSKA